MPATTTPDEVTSRPAHRGAAAARLGVLGTLVVLVVGVAGRFVSWPLLTATLGPTVYVFLAHPKSATARVRAAVIGHSTAIAAGLAALAVFGLWSHLGVSTVGHPTLRQAAAAACAVGATLAVLEVSDTHHAPAAATALLIATGDAHPGRPLFGLLVGLAAVIVLTPLVGKLPWGRAALEDGSGGDHRRPGLTHGGSLTEGMTLPD